MSGVVEFRVVPEAVLINAVRKIGCLGMNSEWEDSEVKIDVLVIENLKRLYHWENYSWSAGWRWDQLVVNEEKYVMRSAL